MSSLIKRTSTKGTKYYLSYSYTEYGKDGRSINKNKWIMAGDNKAEADRFKRDFDKEYKNNRVGFNKYESIKLEDFVVKEYLPWCATRKSPKTYLMTKSNMEMFINFFGNCYIEDINIRMIEKWILMRKDQGRANRTINIGLTYLSQCLKKAIHWDYIKHNVMNRVERLKENSGRLRYFSTEEVRMILEKANPYLQRFIAVGVMTGMRHGEILSIKLKHIDVSNNIIHLVNDNDFQTKNRRNRSIPIPPKLAELLPYYTSTWVDQANMEVYPRTNEQKEYLFCSREGSKLSCFRKSYDRHLISLGLKDKDTNIHTLRHTYASHLVMNGAGIRTVQVLLGHASIKVTEKYAHLSGDHIQEAVKLLCY